jgi:hypothetical protein
MRIEFGLLGETWARLDGHEIDLGPVRQRSVLAVLLAEANRIVPLDQLIDRVWGEARPHTAVATMRTYLSRLRTALSAAGECAIRHGRGGYVLEVDEAAVDLHLFAVLSGRLAPAAGTTRRRRCSSARWNCGGVRRSPTWTPRGRSRFGARSRMSGLRRGWTITTSGFGRDDTPRCSLTSLPLPPSIRSMSG